MAATTNVQLGNCRFELLTSGEEFRGLGRVWIGDTLVRSGRLPVRLYSQTFTGSELTLISLVSAEEHADELRIHLRAEFQPLEVKLMTDHSLDPIHDTGDWAAPALVGAADIALVIRPARYEVHGVEFTGFEYHYEYSSANVPVFYLMEKASWELDGDIAGATVYNQSACSDPVVTFAEETFWTTEGELFFLDQASHFNRVMTHNLPRWTDHQAFDFQFKGDQTLLGIFDHVDLIRTVLRRDPGRPELKCFDKHIFDEALTYATSPKAIVLNSDPKPAVDQQNLWTWIFDDTSRKARAEFGLKDRPPVPMMGDHHWTNFTVDTYYKDILPACAAVGIKLIFAENFKRSDAAEPHRLISGNMCTSHEYEIAPELGGMAKFKEYIERCHQHGIKNTMWSNTYVSLNAKMNMDQRDERGWYMAMNDTRTKYAGAYTMVSSNLDLKNPDARRYWIDAHRKIVEESGLDGFYLDSYYNLMFMPVNYKTGHPRTSWRETLQAMKELQDAGVEWVIESFGPFGMAGHGHVDSYDPSKIFICYTVGLGNNYVTVPVPGVETEKNTAHDVPYIYYQLAHKVPCAVPLFIDGKRIDEVYGPEHRRVLAEYHALLPEMHTRYLQEDGLSVLWHNETGTRALLWNFTERDVALPGAVFDLAGDRTLDPAATYRLKAQHTYAITCADLPVCVTAPDASLYPSGSSRRS